MAELVQLFLKVFFILTPFFVLSVFISLTRDVSAHTQKILANRLAMAVLISCVVIFLTGRYIFEIFGITLDAFRIGAGSVLFLSAISMVNGGSGGPKRPGTDDGVINMAVVPLAMPVTVGPGVIGVLLVLGVEHVGLTEKLKVVAAIAMASAALWVILRLARTLGSRLGSQGMEVIARLTGLFVSAIAAQIIFTGVRNFMA
ncbi:MarC family protein [Pelagibaculum spongiae]|uniref:UPF0056 membrane protein n=1 Tax=Pelagibaculum spongiae TaxID=2080658 RepID=A0A2V1GN64_9GAMM|nr:MarC family protein [Pelagibaculum spongiae]PVZ62970.1 hypothetical protein DC094_21630 [Pelagibaculum spongiae]